MLATASDHALASRVAEHLGLFEAVHASDGRTNLKGSPKSALLVDEILVPILRDEYGVDGLDHSPRWARVMGQLRQAAEDAKIQLSRADTAVVEVGDIKDANDTLLVKDARSRNCTVVTGVAMFVRQACRQYELFTGQKGPAELMRETIRRAIGAAKY